MFVTAVKEMQRGVDWVKFLVGIDPPDGRPAYTAAEDLHAAWRASRTGQDEFGCGPARVMPYSLDRSKVVFKFGTEPYSMKSNDCYRYIDAFGRWVDSGRLPLAGTGISVSSPDDVPAPTVTIDFSGLAERLGEIFAEKERKRGGEDLERPAGGIYNGVSVRSFASRIRKTWKAGAV